MHAYLDREIDELTATRITHHLEICWECGMEVDLYLEIKQAVAAKRNPLPQDTLSRLQDFARSLAEETQPPTRRREQA